MIPARARARCCPTNCIHAPGLSPIEINAQSLIVTYACIRYAIFPTLPLQNQGQSQGQPTNPPWVCTRRTMEATEEQVPQNWFAGFDVRHQARLGGRCHAGDQVNEVSTFVSRCTQQGLLRGCTSGWEFLTDTKCATRTRQDSCTWLDSCLH